MAIVIAYGTGRQAYFDLFIESCLRYDINPVILGWNDAWIGSGEKLLVIKEYLKSLPEEEVVISVDPFDVIFLTSLDEIEKKFRAQFSPFLCGALRLRPFFGSIYNFEFNTGGEAVPSTPTGYKYLNAGTWISKAGYARRLIGRMVNHFHLVGTSIDQQLLTGIYVEDQSEVDIDWSCEIFHNLLFRDMITRRADLKDINFRRRRVYNFHTDSLPCILHASGNTNMRGIAKKLGYGEAVSRPVDDNYGFAEKARFHFGQILKNYFAIVRTIIQTIPDFSRRVYEAYLMQYLHHLRSASRTFRHR